MDDGRVAVEQIVKCVLQDEEGSENRLVKLVECLEVKVQEILLTFSD